MAWSRLALLVVVADALSVTLDARPLVISHVTVIDVNAGKALPDRTVVVDGGVIRAVSADARVPKGAVEVDGRGKYLIPGLWDMHVHFRGGEELTKENEASLSLFVALGITGVREMGGDIVSTVLRWRKEIAAGKRVGPRIVTCGPKLDGPKPVWPGSIAVKDAAGGRAAVRQVKKMHADFVKLYFADVEKDVFAAIVDEARKQHLPVSGHIPTASLSVREFVDAGVHSVEHSRHYILPGTSRGEEKAFAEMREWVRAGRKPTSNMNVKIMEGLDLGLEAELMTRLKQHDVWVTPTLVVTRRTTRLGKEDYSNDPRRKYVGEGMWKSWQADGRRKPPTDGAFATLEQLELKNFELVVKMQKSGVGLLAGSDSGTSNNFTFPGFSLHEELRMMVTAGMSPMEALRTATLNAAKYLGEEAKWGAVEVGKRADLVLLSADPLAEIGNTEKVEAVVMKGRLFGRGELDGLRGKASQGK